MTRARATAKETMSGLVPPRLTREGRSAGSFPEQRLVISFRGVNFTFWSRLGCSGQNTIIFSRKGLF